MKTLLYILSILLVVNINLIAESSALAIDVEAGESTTICYGETLDLSILGASISGDVDDGLWFSMGDGVFLPGAQTNGVFSSTTQYQPGPQDQSDGSFTLILVSDDPDGNGPMVEVSDVVTVSFMNAPALVCNNSINVSLSEGCEQLVDVFMLLANPMEPYNKYDIEVFDENGIVIADNLLTVDHIGMEITFEVGHDCTNSHCSGDISVSDNISPFLNCIDAEVECELGTSPESVGLPVPFYATATATGDYSYSVVDFDDCGVVTLTYDDIEQEMSCAGTGYIMEITRSWFAEDESGNTSSCEQTILVRPLLLSAVVLPENYDGAVNDPLSCNGDWIALDETGYPSPESTGMPSFPDCGNIEATYSDAYFEECGAGFKVVRQWFIIDWCTTNSVNHNQIIKILDQEGPVFDCPSDLTISSQAYACLSVSETLEFVEEVSDCSEYNGSYQILDLSGSNISNQYLNGATINDLPVGEYQLVYIATDVCNNSNSCTTALTVVDDAAPFAVCDGFTQVSVGSNGVADIFASSLDDDSFDNCGEITMEIAKMTDKCGWGLSFGPTAHFCCDEIGDTVLVAFQVTDEQGLSNTCMVNVFVEDKLPPVLECPTDVTVSCSFDFDPDELSVFGQVLEGNSSTEDIIINSVDVGDFGYYYDNCGATLEETSVSDLDCGSGTITRTFTATDLYGQTAQCSQTITIVNDDPFLSSDITWPVNIETNGCDTIQANPSMTGEPTLNNDKCALVASTYEDQYFYISGGACIKVLREWTVIDWCQYEPGNSQGLWTYLQEIKLKNNILPEFVSCEDQEICSYDEDCQSELVTITAYANDDCTDSLNLLYIWKLDIDDNGTIDETGQGITFDRELDLGAHRVFWTVEDGCGNSTDCDYRLDIRDCKNPTPYCTSSITTTIMPVAGEIQIWATDFDIGATDNCTAPEDLIFSFSPDINDDNRVYNCDSIINGVAQIFTLDVWVTDEWGNQERCSVTFIVQDNADFCNNGTIKGKILGRVATHDDKNIPDAEIDVTASIDTFSGFEMTNDEGEFEYDKAPEYLNYTLRPFYNSSPNSGVSTLDLVMIQQHILGIKEFDNPYDIIASDVSKNEKINSTDLLTLRKMILGVITEWPKDITNWTFVDSSFVFEDETYPYYYPDSITISYLDDSTGLANFVAVKIGDVNGSYNPLVGNDAEVSESRNDNNVEMTINDGILSFEVDDVVDGLQFSLQISEGLEVESSYLTEEDYVIEDNILKVSWINRNRVDIDKEIFISIIGGVDFEFELTKQINPEVYTNMEVNDLILNQTSTTTAKVLNDQQQITIHSNPFSHDLRLTVDENVDQIDIEIIDVSGNLIFTEVYSNPNELSIPNHVFGTSGLYFLRYKIDQETKTVRVIKQ